jgi:hypothetical protein
MSQKLLVKDVMSKPVSIAKSALIPEALAKMLEAGIDPIVVTSDHVVVGTASRRTIAEKMGSKKREIFRLHRFVLLRLPKRTLPRFIRTRMWRFLFRSSRDTRLLLCGMRSTGLSVRLRRVTS